MRRRAHALWLLGLLVAVAPRTVRAQAPDDCTLHFPAGRARGAVKTRTAADGVHYADDNHGRTISVPQWFEHVCSPGFNAKVPATVDDSPTAPVLPGVETQRVKLRGYLLAVEFQKRGDLDLHAELGATPRWHEPHVIVEVPPGPEYCTARKTLWHLVQADAAPLKDDAKILAHPVEVMAEGDVFLDANHGHPPCRNPGSNNWCDRNGGRGILKNHTPSMLRGCWEVHPVLVLKKVAR